MVLTAAVLAFLFVGVVVTTGGGSDNAVCAATSDGKTAAAHEPIDGYSGDQLANAAAIMNAGAAMGLDVQGQTIGVMTAIGESTLRVIDRGDAAGPDSRGLFQQRANGAWGTYADRMDPTTSATNFFKKLVRVPNWQTMPPSRAANAVQINRDPDHYTKYYDAAKKIVAGLAGGDSACAAGVGGDAQALAKHIVDLTNQGKVTWLTPTHFPEVQAIADGHPKANCGIDTRILQVITVATKTFKSVGISDVNRLCTGQRPGAGNMSAHVVNGGGHAVDFYAFDGTATTGSDANAVKLLRALGPVMADGSGTGQVQCRAAAGTSLDLPMKQFDDSCNHVHVQVDPNGKEPMKLGGEDK
jgi:hypothetical protein